MNLLEARDVAKEYRSGRTSVCALSDVSLTVAKGTFAVLTGPSGSGKTTLLALLGALERPTRGQILFDGRDFASFGDAPLARIRRRMGFIFQDFALIPSLQVWENVADPLVPLGASRTARRKRAGELLDRFAIGSKFSASPAELSGGEQQRVAAARALAADPEVLFADEPTSNLDAAAAAELAGILRTFHEGGGAVVVATHDPALVASATAVHTLTPPRQAPT